jgi:hypothetical protein
MPENWSNVYWLGGSPCAGKSSITRRLADVYGIQLLEVDARFDEHAARFTPAQQPALTAWLAGDCTERWLKPVAELTADATACYAEHFAFILEDVSDAVVAGGASRPLLVEGSALLPHLVSQHLPDPRNALWLVPSPAFQRHHYSQRPWIKEVLADCPDADRAFDGWMARDEAFANQVAEAAQNLGLRVEQSDSSHTIAEQAATIAAWYGWHQGNII